jgi:hypothetical protein
VAGARTFEKGHERCAAKQAWSFRFFTATEDAPALHEEGLMKTYFWLTIAGVLLVAAGFTAIGATTALAQEPAEGDPPFLAEYFSAWVNSPHADATAEAFVHWDSEGEIPIECATCHSTPGYIDFLGGDGSEAGVVDAPAPLGTVVSCDACHNPAAASLTEVTFPSGITVSTSGDAARCMVCHQGRASGLDLTAAFEANGMLDDMNAPNADIGFINIHYYAAAATLYGSEAHGGFQYDGMAYAVRNDHVEGFNTCSDCHNPHSLELEIEACSTCHEGVETVEDLRDIRMEGSLVDFDGDDDDFEGIYYELETLQEILYEAIQAYAAEVAGTPIVYDSLAYPYFFIDTDADGEVTEGEAAFPNQFTSWTANLLSAAYNFQVVAKDPGGYAHNPTYLIQLMYDSIMSLNGEISEPVDMEFARRDPHGHFDSTADAFRHWDEDGMVAGSCVKCHTAEGLPMFLANNATIAVEPSASLACTTCHTDLVDFTIYEIAEVTFPSGAKVSFGEGDGNNLCLSCHQGRESTVSVNRAIQGAGVGDDEVSERLAFRNVHYFAAGATMFGTEVKGAYEFADLEYNGRNIHVPGEVETCADCHDVHRQELDLNVCQDCHDVETIEDVRNIRVGDSDEDIELVDYNGNGIADEPMRDEIQTLIDDLFVRIQTYATDVAGMGILYDSHAYPYFFADLNGNGELDPDEANGGNSFKAWTPNLLRAAYNFQYMQKDPGVYAHNPRYALQVLYDSIQAIGGEEAVANYIRPDVTMADS